MAKGAEDRTFWFWRPVIYTTGTVVVGVFGGPVTGAVSGVNYATIGIEAVQVQQFAKAGILLMNQAKGAIGETLAASRLAEQGVKIIGRRVSVQTSAGRRVIDLLVEVNGKLINVEVKTGNAVRSTSQLDKDAAMAVGGRLVGKNARTLAGEIRDIATVVYQLP